MGKSTPQAPTPPDPKVVAGAQTGSNVSTAIANSYIGNANQYGPNGSTTFDVAGYNDVVDPSTGQTYKVPNFNQTTTLSPAQQQLLDQQNALGSQMNTLAGQQLSNIGNVLSKPVQAPGWNIQNSVTQAQAPTSVNMSKVPTNVAWDKAQTSVDWKSAPTTFGNTAGSIQYGLGPQDWSADRQRVEEALYSRLNPQLALDRAQLDTQRANEGFTRGDAGYNNAMDAYNRQANDARMQTILAGGQEQSRLFGLDLAQGQFNNQAQQQDYSQLLGKGQFAQQGIGMNNQAALNAGQFNQAGTALNNAAGLSAAQFAQQGTQLNNTNALAQGQFAQQGIGMNNQSALNAANLNNAAYGQQLQTNMALQNQPINAVSALMSGGQVSMPQFAGYQGGSVNPTPIGDYYMQNAQMANQNYQQQLQANAQQQAGLYGGIGSMIGMGLYGGLK